MGAGASRKAAVASLKDKKITVAMLTFDEIDTDKNGKLSCEEISEALAKHFKEGISKDSIASVVAAFDTDGDDQLDRQEFDAVLHELNQKAAGSQADLEDAAAEKAAAEKKEAAADVKLEILLAQAMEQGLVEADACEKMRENVRSGRFTAEHYTQMWSSRLEKAAAAKAEAAAAKAEAAAKVLAAMTPTAQATAEALTIRLLESLAAKEERVSRPTLSRSERRRSGQRGMSRALLFGVKAFYAQHNALDKSMQDIVNERLFLFSACELTKSTGLSLAETLALEVGEGEGIEELVGDATCFFSYSWTGTTLRDLLHAVER
eukprot:scaffold72196_cov59-Phaeocystis_antarctica.AAC.1